MPSLHFSQLNRGYSRVDELNKYVIQVVSEVGKTNATLEDCELLLQRIIEVKYKRLFQKLTQSNTEFESKILKGVGRLYNSFEDKSDKKHILATVIHIFPRISFGKLYEQYNWI